MPELKDLEKQIGHTFKKPELLKIALTHSSTGAKENYETIRRHAYFAHIFQCAYRVKKLYKSHKMRPLSFSLSAFFTLVFAPDDGTERVLGPPRHQLGIVIHVKLGENHLLWLLRIDQPLPIWAAEVFVSLSIHEHDSLVHGVVAQNALDVMRQLYVQRSKHLYKRF